MVAAGPRKSSQKMLRHLICWIRDRLPPPPKRNCLSDWPDTRHILSSHGPTTDIPCSCRPDLTCSDVCRGGDTWEHIVPTLGHRRPSGRPRSTLPQEALGLPGGPQGVPGDPRSFRRPKEPSRSPPGELPSHAGPQDAPGGPRMLPGSSRETPRRLPGGSRRPQAALVAYGLPD